MLEPSTTELQRMLTFLFSGEWQARTETVAQEFLNYWFSKDERWMPIPPQYNVQLHQVFLSSICEPPAHQNKLPQFYDMLQNIEIIRIWLFSDEFEPVHCLKRFAVWEAVAAVEAKVLEFTAESMRCLCMRMDKHLRNNAAHVELMQGIHAQAIKEWLRCWEQTWSAIYRHAMEKLQ